MSRPDAILDYQKVDLEKQQTEAGLRNTEARIRYGKLNKLLKAQQATLKKLTDDLELISASVQRLNRQHQQVLKRLELETSELETLEDDAETTAEEMTEFRHDIERLNREVTAIEKDLKQTFTTLERQIAEYQKTRQVAVKAKKEYDQVKEICIKERDDVQKELDNFDRQLGELEKNVDPKLMTRYKRARQHYGTPVVPVKDGKCSGCNMGLPTLALSRLSGGMIVAECENCGRLLYME